MSSNRKELPSTDTDEHSKLVDELQFLGEMSSTEAALFHHHAAAANGLGITDSKTISTLMQEGPMTAGEIAKRLGLTSGAVTNVIDRLVRAGFVRRVADPKDRRKVIVEADVANLAKLSNVYESVGDAFRKLHEQYSVEQLQFLIDYFKQSVAATKMEVAKLASSGE
jgi:DNA-binding MarR family transcriptional regulator